MTNKTIKRRSPKRRRDLKTHKSQYRIRNRSEYNAALKQRGSLTVWLDSSTESIWQTEARSGRRGASRLYSDSAIQAALTLKAVYHLLRAAEGLLSSVLQLMGLGHLRVPDYSTVCRRQKSLPVTLSNQRAVTEPVHLVIDATGCKLYGEGEWKVRQHGYSKRRTWLKLHLGINEATGEILSAMLTTNNVSDAEVLPDLLEQVEAPLSQVSADGAYDKRSCYKVLEERQQGQGRELKVAIPPRRNARIWQHGNTKSERLARDENLRRIHQIGVLGGRRKVAIIGAVWPRP